MRGSTRLITAALALATAWVVGITLGAAGAQGRGAQTGAAGSTQGRGGQAAAAASAQTPPGAMLAEQAFKNIQAPALKTISVDDFLLTMGIMTSSLGFDCAVCFAVAWSFVLFGSTVAVVTPA